MEQTNRTILFAEINPNKNNLLTLVEEVGKRESLTDEEIMKIHQTLAVSSFQEFISKFTPSVNMLLDTNNQSVTFSKQYLGNGQETLKLDLDASLFSMLLYIMEAKQKKKYVLTTFGDLLDNMIPKENTTRFMEERSKCIQKMKRSNRDEADGVKRYLKKNLPQFDDGIFLLTAFLKDVINLLPYMGKEIKKDKAILDDEDRMQIKVIKKAKKYRKKQLYYEQFDTNSYEQIITEYMSEVAVNGGIRHTKLLRDCMLLPVLFLNKDYSAIQRQYTEYCNLYIEIIKKFWAVVKPVIETMLGIKEFFNQYGDVEGMKPTLIISNFPVSDILTPKNRDKLEIYLNSVNSKNFYKNTIWYSIIPNIASENEVAGRVIRERFTAKREQYQYQRTEMEEVSLLLELLAKYRVQNFLSMALTEENTFSTFAQKGISGINESFEALEKVGGKDFVIPCFPNFIVVSSEESCLCIGKELMFDDLEERIVIQGDINIWLDEIGIEASYVAAGLVAACQCPQYLKKHYRRGVNENLPGVAYRFTDGEHNLITTSNMLSETTEFSEELLEEAMARSRGLLFGQKNGRMVVLTDRVFSYSSGNRLLISMVQTLSYMERMIQYETQDFKKNLIHQFFQKRPGSVISQWFSNDAAVINAILKENEKIDYKVDDTDNQCTFSVYFNSNDLVKREKVSIFIE